MRGVEDGGATTCSRNPRSSSTDGAAITTRSAGIRPSAILLFRGGNSCPPWLRQGKPVRVVDLSAAELRAALAQPFAPGGSPPPQSPPRAPDQIEPPFDKLPVSLQRGHLWALQRYFSKAGTVAPEERLMIMESARATFVTLREAREKQEHPLGDIPLIVLTRGKDTSAEYNQMQKGLARLSRNSKYSVATKSGHLLHLDQPDLVVHAIREVVEAARQGTQLSSARDRNRVSGGLPTAVWNGEAPGMLVSQFLQSPRVPLEFYIEVGRYETTLPFSPLLETRRLRDVLEAKRYPVTYSEFVGGHNEVCWRGSFADAIMALASERKR
jgi:hypothetical protein